MPSKLWNTLAIAVLTIACGDSAAKDEDKGKDASTRADAGKPSEDRDASKPDPEGGAGDCDKLDTPGNDCSDAVGCREALECGLAASSCCVPGFDVENVKCIDDTKCAAGAGRASCDGPEDCAGKACCVDTVQGTTGCSDSCGTKIALCHTDADCESPKVCTRGNSFTWWGVCG